MLNKLNELESKTRIVSGDCYIDIYGPSVVWRSRGKKHLKLVSTLTDEDADAVKIFFQKVLPVAEKKVLEEHVEKVMSQETASTRAPPGAPSKAEKMCLSAVAGAVVKCPDYGDCWDGPFLKDNNKCGHKASPRPRSAPTQAPGYSERAKPT